MRSDDFDSILVVVPAQLGDVLLCTPTIHAARQRWPRARIDVLGFEGTLALLDGNPDVDNLVTMSSSSKGGWRGRLGEIRRIWRRYDLALVARATDRAHVAGWLAARRRSALLPQQGGNRGWKRWLSQHHADEVDGTPVVMRSLQLLAPWAKPAGHLSVEAPPPLPLPAALEAQLRHPCVVVQVPSMWRYKQWPTRHFQHVVEGLLADGTQVVLTGGPSPSDLAQVEPLRALGREPDLIDGAGRLNLRQVRALLAHADAYLGPDTSVTHLAAAVDLPIVTVFGPTPPQSFGPWPRDHAPVQPWQARAQRQQVGKVIVLQGPDRTDRPGCVPCGRMGCEHHHASASACLDGLAPERVLDELRQVLRDRTRREEHAGTP